MKKPRGRLDGLVEWSRREAWRDRMGEMIDRHIGKACDLNEIDIFDLTDIVGDAAIVAMDCAFEDCCTVTWDDGSNIANDYLKRRGWKETVINRAYIEAVRDSVMSLYEVSEVQPGKSFLARDLVRGGEPIQVPERTATKTLVQWDVIAARIVTVRGKVQMTGGVLTIDRALADEILAMFKRAQSRAIEAVKDQLSGIKDPILRARFEAELAEDHTMLATTASSITTIWLDDAIKRCRAPAPQMANTDGDNLEFLTLHYKLAPDATDSAVAEALASIPDLYATGNDKGWTWFAPQASGQPDPPYPSAEEGNAGRTIHGHLTLDAGKLKVMVNSETRAERIKGVLGPALDGLARAPLIERMTFEQAFAEHATSTPSMAVSNDLAPADIKNAVHQVLTLKYRETLKQKIPMLGNKSPRQAVRSAEGRLAVANWLKGLEQTTAHSPVDDPMHSYDFGWMWEELGIADLRE